MPAPPVLVYYSRLMLLDDGRHRHLLGTVALMEFAVCTVPRVLLAARQVLLYTLGEQTSMVVSQPVLPPVSDNLQQVIADVHLNEVVRQTNFDAAWSEMAWPPMATIDWDQLTTGDPIHYVRVDVEDFVAFCPVRDVPHLGITFLPVRSDVELHDRGYYESSSNCAVAAVNLSRAVEIPDYLSSVSSQLVVSSTVQPISSSFPRATVFTPSLVLNSDFRAFCSALRSVYRSFCHVSFVYPSLTLPPLCPRLYPNSLPLPPVWLFVSTAL